MKTNKTQSSKERRKYTRYSTADGAFAAVSPNSYKLGQIINISRGGLAFRYIDTNRSSLGEREETHVFLSSKGNYVRSIPFTTVSDCEVPKEHPFSTLKMRQCAVQFGEMSYDQSINLDNYILNNADHFSLV